MDLKPNPAASSLISKLEELTRDESFGEGDDDQTEKLPSLTIENHNPHVAGPEHIRSLNLRPTDRLYVRQIFYKPSKVPNPGPPLNARLKELKSIFNLFDDNGRNELTAEGIKEILMEIRFVDDVSLTHDDYVKIILDRSDQDRSGGLNFEEFCSDPIFQNLSATGLGAKEALPSLKDARQKNPSKSLGQGGDLLAFETDTWLTSGESRVYLEWKNANQKRAAESAEVERREREILEAQVAHDQKLFGSFYGMEDGCYQAILGFLPLDVLIRTVLVSKKFHAMAKSPSLWTELRLNSMRAWTHPGLYTRIALLKLMDFSAAGVMATGLDLSHTDHSDENVHTLLRGLSSTLKHCSLQGAPLVTDKAGAYISLYSEVLEGVDVRDTSISADRFVDALKQNGVFKTLRSLAIGAPEQQALGLSPTGIRDLTQFRELRDLRCIGLRPEVATAVVDGDLMEELQSRLPFLERVELSLPTRACQERMLILNPKLSFPTLEGMVEKVGILSSRLKGLTLRNYATRMDVDMNKGSTEEGDDDPRHGALPLALSTFRWLEWLDLGGCTLHSIPEGILCHMETLTHLALDHLTHLQTLPSDLPHTLRHLDVRATALDPLECRIFAIPELRVLRCSGSTRIFREAGAVADRAREAAWNPGKGARHACLPPVGDASQPVPETPPEPLVIERNLIPSPLHHLTNIVLAGQGIGFVHPAFFRAVPALTSLDLSHNLLNAFPHEVRVARNLQALKLDHNLLEQVPFTDGIASLPSLRALDISFNRMSVGMRKQAPPNLEIFWTGGNPCLREGLLNVPFDTISDPVGRTLKDHLSALILRRNPFLSLPMARPTAIARKGSHGQTKPRAGSPPKPRGGSPKRATSPPKRGQSPVKPSGSGDAASVRARWMENGRKLCLTAVGVIFVQAMPKSYCVQFGFVACPLTAEAQRFHYFRGFCVLSRGSLEEILYHDVEMPFPTPNPEAPEHPPMEVPVGWWSSHTIPQCIHNVQVMVEDTSFTETSGGRKIEKHQVVMTLSPEQDSVADDDGMNTDLGHYLKAVEFHIKPLARPPPAPSRGPELPRKHSDPSLAKSGKARKPSDPDSAKSGNVVKLIGPPFTHTFRAAQPCEVIVKIYSNPQFLLPPTSLLGPLVVPAKESTLAGEAQPTGASKERRRSSSIVEAMAAPAVVLAPRREGYRDSSSRDASFPHPNPSLTSPLAPLRPNPPNPKQLRYLDATHLGEHHALGQLLWLPASLLKW